MNELPKGQKPSVSVLLKYQKELKANVMVNDITVVEKSRRIGMTWAAGSIAVENGALGRSHGGMNVYYIGYNLEMARDFIDVCGQWAKAYNFACSQVEEFVFTDKPNNEDGDKDIKAFRISFESGFEIVALASRPRVLRGKQGLVIIDEAAFHDDLTEMLKAAYALLMWGGKVVILSTHNGIDNPFNELVESIKQEKEGFEDYALMRVTLDEALEDGLYERICMVKKEPYSIEAELKWREKLFGFYGDAADEELNVIPRSSSGGWLPFTLIDARMEAAIPVLRIERPDAFKHVNPILREQEIGDWLEKIVKPELDKLDKTKSHCLGGDFGRSGDGTCFWPIAIMQNTKRHTPFIVEINNLPFAEQQQILFYILDNLPRKAGIALDARGIGAQMSEACYDRYGSIVHEVMASEAWYRDNMPPLKGALEDDAFSLPRDADIEKDLRSVEIVKGVPRVSTKRSKGKDGKQRHADSVIAAVLALFASRNMVIVEYALHRVPKAGDGKSKKSHRNKSNSRFGRNKRVGI